MKKLAITIILLLSLAAFAGAATDDPTPLLESTSKDQIALSLTVYNNDIGLVKDSRLVRIPKGISQFRFMDVASRILPETVYIKSLQQQQGLFVLEQNYEYDLLTSKKLLNKYVGKEISLYQKNPYTDKEEIVQARLLSNNDGPIYQIGKHIVLNHSGRVLLPELPSHLIVTPTLIWMLKNNTSDEQKIVATYLTNGITWRADYIAVFSALDDHADISGWVTIDNKSGAAFHHAAIKVVAGDLNRVTDDVRFKIASQSIAAAEQRTSTQFEEESFFEYHIYTLQRPSSLDNNQIKQIRFMNALNVPIKKEFIITGQPEFYLNRMPEPVTDPKVGVYAEIENKTSHQLGIPLPKGIIRVYKEDTSGSLELIGADRINHTPKDEKIRVKLGNVFDVAAIRKQTDWKKSAKNTIEASYEISLRNHKKETVSIKVIEQIPGDWTMLSASHDYKKTTSRSAEFIVRIPPGQERVVTYTVKVHAL